MKKLPFSLVPCCALALALACLLLAPSSVRAQNGGRGLTFAGAGGPGAVTLSSTQGQFNSPFSMMGGMSMMGMGGMGMGGMGMMGMGGMGMGGMGMGGMGMGGMGGLGMVGVGGMGSFGGMMGGMGMGGMGGYGMGGKAFGFNGGFGQ
jgi:hypothetical protein